MFDNKIKWYLHAKTIRLLQMMLGQRKHPLQQIKYHM
jgi:hypothetical protein